MEILANKEEGLFDDIIDLSVLESFGVDQPETLMQVHDNYRLGT